MTKFTLLLVSLFSCFGILTAQICNLDFEDFETATNANPPAGWVRDGSYIGDFSPYNGMKHAGFNTEGDILIVEPLTCPGEISFYWRASGGSSNYDIDIDWSTDGGTTWTTAHTISLNGSNSPTTYSQAIVDLPEHLFPAPFENVLVRFHQSRRVGGSFYLDDVCMTEGTCTVTPTQLTFNNLQAGCLQKNTPFSITVCATDAGGNVDDTFVENINLSLNSGTGTLSGTTTEMATNGCAVFDNISLSEAGIFTLNAGSTTLSGTSGNIEITDVCALTETLKVMTYNLLNFPNGRDDCGATNTVIPARWDTLRKIVQYIEPDILMVCELHDEVGADMILNEALNVFGKTHYARANFVVNQSSSVTELNNMFFYNTQKVTMSAQTEVATDLRDIGKYTVFLNDPNLASHNDTTFIDFYDAHLKAGSTASDITRRSGGCTDFRNHVDALPAERNAIIGGDFNFYDSAEAGYQTLLSGTFPFNDPLNRPGSWDSDAAFADVHTQSTRAPGSDQLDCGAPGGMDSRFDFLLASNPIMNGTGNVQFSANSYHALGNDGNLYNKEIIDAANASGVPDSVLNALKFMSDHLPVILDLDVTYPLTVLPVELLSFSGKKTDNRVLLEWEAILDNQHAFFEIQFSENGRDFEKIGKEESRKNDFQFWHQPTSKMAYYRLKQVDFDGNFAYSEIVAIPFSNKQEIKIWTAENTLFVQSEEDMEQAEIIVYNVLGQVVFYQKAAILKSRNEINLKNNLPNGILIFQVKNTKNGQVWNQKGLQ